MTERILTGLALALLAAAALIFLGLWAFAGQLHPVALYAISGSAFVIARRARRRR